MVYIVSNGQSTQSNNIVLKGTNTWIDKPDRFTYITYVNGSPHRSNNIKDAMWNIWTTELKRKREFVFTNNIQGDLVSCYYIEDRNLYMVNIGSETFYYQSYTDVKKEVKEYFEENIRNGFLFGNKIMLIHNQDKYNQIDNIILKGTNTWIDRTDENTYITYVNGTPYTSVNIESAFDDIWTTELAKEREFTFTNYEDGDKLSCVYLPNKKVYKLLNGLGEDFCIDGNPVITQDYEIIKDIVEDFFAENVRMNLMFRDYKNKNIHKIVKSD